MGLDLKREMLRLLREDEEFRYAVAGMIGLEEILKRLDGHERELVRLREEATKIWREITKVWGEIARLREEMIKGFERHDKILEEHSRILEEHSREIAKLRRDMVEGFKRIDRHISALGARWGLLTEEAFREGIRALLESELGWRVESWIHRDDEGYVYGYPSVVEVDISAVDGRSLLIEVSSHVRPSDVYIFSRKAELYERTTGRGADRLVIVTPYAEREALRIAERYNIEIYTKV